MVEIITEHDVLEGWYPKLHCLTSKTRDKLLTKTEYIFLGLLLHFENRFTKDSNQWFFVTDKDFCKTRLISPKTVIKARKSLKEKGLIDVKTGHSHKATEYKILIDGTFYYRGGHASL